MKVLDAARPAFHSPPRAAVTFKTLLPDNTLTRRQAPVLAAAPTPANSANTVNAVRARLAPVETMTAEAIHARVNQLTLARAAHVKNALAQVAARGEALDDQTTQRRHDAVDAMFRELVNEFGKVPEPTARPVPTSPLGEAATAAAPTAKQVADNRAVQAVRLIEKIDIFVRTQRPALALTLNNSLGARVEIERVGDGRVALRLVGHGGPPSPEAVSRIRDEMEARGLKIAVLAVA